MPTSSISSLGMFGNPLEDGDTDRETLAGVGNAHRQRPSLRHRHDQPASPDASAASR